MGYGQKYPLEKVKNVGNENIIKKVLKHEEQNNTNSERS